MSSERDLSREVFVAYPWSLYEDRGMYKKTYTDLEKALKVKFLFAEQQVTSGHILDKIIGMIEGSAFGIFDVSSWNANVTLEYGIARGLNAEAFIAFNPDKTDPLDVPSDVRGYDQLRYTSLSELSDSVSKVVVSQLGIESKKERDPLADVSEKVISFIEQHPGKTAAEIARYTGERVDLVRFIVQRNSSQFRTEGKTKGTRYFIDKE